MDDFKSVLTKLGVAIRSRRETLGWSRRELVGRTGISERFIADIEAGRANPSLLKLCELAKAFGVSPDRLLSPVSSKTQRHIIALLGLRGAGKSTVGPLLARRLGHRFIELDDKIEDAVGSTLSEIFELHGEAYHRSREREVLQSLLSERARTVLATGGGLVTQKETFELLRSHAHTVWLRARPEDHWQRVIAQGDTRPMANDDQAFQHLCTILSERKGLYQLAEVTVDTSKHAPKEIARQLALRFERRTQ